MGSSSNLDGVCGTVGTYTVIFPSGFLSLMIIGNARSTPSSRCCYNRFILLYLGTFRPVQGIRQTSQLTQHHFKAATKSPPWHQVRLMMSAGTGNSDVLLTTGYIYVRTNHTKTGKPYSRVCNVYMWNERREHRWRGGCLVVRCGQSCSWIRVSNVWWVVRLACRHYVAS